MHLKQYIKTQSSTVREFCKVNNLEEATIYSLVSGNRKPSYNMMAKIMKITNGAVQPNDWFDFSELLKSI